MVKIRKYISFIVIVIGLLLFASGCSQRVYYSSERVYKARKEQNKRLKRRGYSNQQYRKSRKRRMGGHKRRNFGKKKYKKYGSAKSKGRR